MTTTEPTAAVRPFCALDRLGKILPKRSRWTASAKFCLSDRAGPIEQNFAQSAIGRAASGCRAARPAAVYAQLRRALDELEADLATYPLPAPENAPEAVLGPLAGIPERDRA